MARQLVKITDRMLAEQREYVPYSEHAQQSEGKKGNLKNLMGSSDPNSCVS
jgi:hypothetical protein